MFTQLIIKTVFNKITLHSICVLTFSEIRWPYAACAASEIPHTWSASVAVVAKSAVVLVVVVDSVVVIVAATWKSSVVVASVAQLKATANFS